jgi:hypothetical protein
MPEVDMPKTFVLGHLYHPGTLVRLTLELAPYNYPWDSAPLFRILLGITLIYSRGYRLQHPQARIPGTNVE